VEYLAFPRLTLKEELKELQTDNVCHFFLFIPARHMHIIYSDFYHQIVIFPHLEDVE